MNKLEALKAIQKENKKRNEIYKYGVDLTNYENIYTTVALALLAEKIGCSIDDLEWYIFDEPKKKYYLDDQEIDLTKPEDFIKYYQC